MWLATAAAATHLASYPVPFQRPTQRSTQASASSAYGERSSAQGIMGVFLSSRSLPVRIADGDRDGSEGEQVPAGHEIPSSSERAVL